MTALDLIASSLRLLGILAAGEPVEINDANDSLVTLQQMIDGWNSDGLTIFTTTSTDFPFVANKQTYTLGTGGDFNIARPASIDGMSAILLNNPSNPIELPMVPYTVDQWQNQIPVKAVPSTFPQIYYDDGNFPLRNVSFWPFPSSNINSVRIYSWQPLSSPAALNTVITFPPGYAEAFRFNFALRLAPEFSAPVSPIVQQTAVESLARIKTMNYRPRDLRSDLIPVDGQQNYRQDMFNLGY